VTSPSRCLMAQRNYSQAPPVVWLARMGAGHAPLSHPWLQFLQRRRINATTKILSVLGFCSSRAKIRMIQVAIYRAFGTML
jgi:hypothetical protein